jgi:hypothetical protein
MTRLSWRKGDVRFLHSYQDAPCVSAGAVIAHSELEGDNLEILK